MVFYHDFIDIFSIAFLQFLSRFQELVSYSRPFFRVLGFPGGSDGKEFACNKGDLGFISGLGRSPGEGDGNPLQYSCLENPMDRGVC